MTDLGKWSSGGDVGPGKRVTVSICASVVIISAEVVMSNPVVSSLRMERSVGSIVGVSAHMADWRMVLSATLGSLTYMRRRALPYLRRRG